MVKYQGVILDENLSWESHINYISLKLRKANGALSKIRYYVPNKPYDHYIFFTISLSCNICTSIVGPITKYSFK